MRRLFSYIFYLQILSAGFWKIKIENTTEPCPGKWRPNTTVALYKVDERNPGEEFKKIQLNFGCVKGNHVIIINKFREFWL